MPRVLMVIGHFRPTVGGAAVQAERLAIALVKAHVPVEILTVYPRKLRAHKLQDPVTVHRLKVPGFGKPKMVMLLFAMFLAILKWRHRFDVLHVHQGNYPAFAAVLASRFLHKPVLVKIGNSGPRFDLEILAQTFPLGRRMARYIAKYTTAFVAISSEVALDLRRWGVPESRIYRIPNGVSVGPPVSAARRVFLRQQLGLPRDRPVLMSVGSLMPKKNHEVLLHAILGLRKLEHDPLLIVLGEGPLRTTLQRLTDELGLRDAVRLEGEVQNVGEYLEAADLFLLPSLVEGMSNALLEAMAAGLACLVSDIPANRELISDGVSGILFPLDNVTVLVERVAQLLEDDCLRQSMGDAARRSIVGGYSMEQVATRYRALYGALV